MTAAAHVASLAHEMGALEAIYHRRAVRDFTADPIDDATVRRLLDAAVHAPTAMHQEPWTFLVVQDRAVLQRLSDQAKALAVAEASAHRDLLRAPGAAPDGRVVEMLSDPEFNIFYNAGTLIVVCGRAMGPFVTADCWLAAENLMLAACAMNLGTCCIGFALPALHLPEVKRELGIPKGTEPIAAVIVGVPRAEPPIVPRRAPEILNWIADGKHS